MASFQELLARPNPVLIDFHASWCGPCKMMAPVLDELKSEMGDAVSIIKIDVDRNEPLAQQFSVRGVPTLILFRDGKPVWRQSGAMQKSQIMTALKPFLD